MAGSTVPGPRGRWLVGDMENYVADRIGWLRDTQRRYGDVVRLAPDTVVVHDPATVHQVLAQTNDTYLLETGQLAGRRRRAAALARLDQWMTVRRDIWHGFAASLTAVHLHRLVANAGALLDTHAGTHRDLAQTCRTVTGRLIVDFCLGSDAAHRDLPAEVARRAHRLFDDSLAVLTRGESRRRIGRRPLATAAAKADTDLRDLLADRVAHRRTQGPAQPATDLLDVLVSATEPGADDKIVSVLRMALFASHGVPGAALSWIVLRLAAEPRTAAAIRREATAATRSTRLTPAHLPITAAFVNEVLRLHPPQWLLTRTALRATTIAGYPIRTGQQILICPYLIHRDPRFWSQPERFNPDRWLTGQRPHPPHTYLPFGAGPRICPGSGLAMSQLTLLTAILASTYDVHTPHIDTVDITCDGLLLPSAVSGGWESTRGGAESWSPGRPAGPGGRPGGGALLGAPGRGGADPR